MKRALLFYFMLVALTAFGQEYQVRIAFIGNSITIGSGLANPERDRYPSQLVNKLQQVYGDTIAFENFAVSGRTMLKHGDVPIWNEVRFNDFVMYGCNLCFILMGTNDSKPQNWDQHGNEFIGDYLSMMDTIKSRNPHAKFIICYPPPAFDVVWGIRDSVIFNYVIPAIDSIQKLTGATLVDFYHPLLDSVSLFPDKIHPNARGAKAMANIAFQKFMETDIIHQVETGLTFITKFKTDNNNLCQGDTTLLSWTTYNADSVFLDQHKVDLNGSRAICPFQSRTFKLKAYGKKYTDSLTLEQLVYQPYIYKLLIDPARKTIVNGESVRLHANYFDQNSVLLDTIVSTSWQITEGTGQLTNVSDTAATFVPVNTGKTKITATAGELTGKSTITIDGLSVANDTTKSMVFLSPNPVLNELEVKTQGFRLMSIEIYDLLGNRILVQNKINEQSVIINAQKLFSGVYFITLTDINGQKQSVRFVKL